MGLFAAALPGGALPTPPVLAAAPQPQRVHGVGCMCPECIASAASHGAGCVCPVCKNATVRAPSAAADVLRRLASAQRRTLGFDAPPPRFSGGAHAAAAARGDGTGSPPVRRPALAAESRPAGTADDADGDAVIAASDGEEDAAELAARLRDSAAPASPALRPPPPPTGNGFASCVPGAPE
eukprot:gene14621-25104_t